MSAPVRLEYRAPKERAVRFRVETSAGVSVRTMSAATAAHLDDLRARIGDTPPAVLARVAYYVTGGGVHVVDRMVLARRLRGEGRVDLAREVQTAPPERACVVLDDEGGPAVHGEPAHVLYVAPSWGGGC